MAEYCRMMFGEMLLTEPLEKFPVSGLRCGTSGPGGGAWGSVVARLRRQMSPEDVGIYLGGLWGQDPITYHVSGTVLGFKGPISDKGTVLALRSLSFSGHTNK